MRTKRFLRWNKKAFFIIFKGLSVTKNCIRPENVPLKAVSTTILLVYFIILKRSTCEARKNVFLFYFEVCMLIWTNFETFAITYLRYAACFKNFICKWRLCLFANAKGSGTSFQVAVFAEFCDKTLTFIIWYTLAKFH